MKEDTDALIYLSGITPDEILEISARNPVVYACVSHWRRGACTWEQAMMFAVKALVTQLDELNEKVTDDLPFSVSACARERLASREREYPAIEFFRCSCGRALRFPSGISGITCESFGPFRGCGKTHGRDPITYYDGG